ncbi:MAG: GntR family transcriptional regulator [Lachnospiraceae bacterium]|jgi:GntR family transcriptional regulator|nr:GntR family transcriptional regulator [Lachnospiraceae bacterium]
MPWNLDSDRPIFIQIIDKIQMDIISGLYQPGDKLPSVRELAQEASVNPNTMQKALSELERTGLVYSQRTSGRFITEDTDMICLLKEQQAQEIALHFLGTMQKLGFQKDDILSLLGQLLEQEAPAGPAT